MYYIILLIFNKNSLIQVAIISHTQLYVLMELQLQRMSAGTVQNGTDIYLTKQTNHEVFHDCYYK
jgi:hypothetical protein